MSIVLGLSGSQVFFLTIKLLIAFYAIRTASRRNDRQMALAYGIAWLGIIMMSFYTLTIPGGLIAIAGIVYILKLMGSRTDQSFSVFRDRVRELGGALNGDTFLASTQIKKPKKEVSQEEIDKKYKKEKWK